jgi:hypothetical protein
MNFCEYGGILKYLYKDMKSVAMETVCAMMRDGIFLSNVICVSDVVFPWNYSYYYKRKDIIGLTNLADCDSVVLWSHNDALSSIERHLLLS